MSAGPAKPCCVSSAARDAALRGMRGLDALAGGARVVELRDAARIAAGEPDRGEDLARRRRRTAAGRRPPRCRTRRRCRCSGSRAGNGRAAPTARRGSSPRSRRRPPPAHRGPDAPTCSAVASAADQAAMPGCSIAPTWVSSASKLEPKVTLRNVACCGLSVSGENSTCDAPGFADHAGIVARPLAPRQPRADRADAQMIEQQPAELAAHVVRQSRRIELRGECRQRARRRMGLGIHAIVPTI